MTLRKCKKESPASNVGLLIKECVNVNKYVLSQYACNGNVKYMKICVLVKRGGIRSTLLEQSFTSSTSLVFIYLIFLNTHIQNVHEILVLLALLNSCLSPKINRKRDKKSAFSIRAR